MYPGLSIQSCCFYAWVSTLYPGFMRENSGQGCDKTKLTQTTWLNQVQKFATWSAWSQIDHIMSYLTPRPGTLHPASSPSPYLKYHNSSALSTLTFGTSLRQISELLFRLFRCKYVELTSVLMLFILSRDITWSQIVQNEPVEPFIDFISIFIASA